MVRVGWSADFAEALKQPVDAQAEAHTLPENWWTYPATLGKQESDIEVTKRQWGAFYGTDLELQPPRDRHHYSLRHLHQHRRRIHRPQCPELGFNPSSPKMPAAPPPPSSIRAV